MVLSRFKSSNKVTEKDKVSKEQAGKYQIKSQIKVRDKVKVRTGTVQSRFQNQVRWKYMQNTSQEGRHML